MLALICTTLLVETSPQGLPLGAACIASAVKNDSRTKEKFSVSLMDFSLEDEEIIHARKTGGDKAISALIARRLAAQNPDFVAFSVYVWNRVILEKASVELKRLLPDCVCVAGGPEVTANPLSFASFDFMIAGQGERAMVELLANLSLSDNAESLSGLTRQSFEQGRAFGIQGVYQNSEWWLSEVETTYCEMSADSGGFDRLNYHNSSDKHHVSPEIIRACPLPPDLTSSPYLDGTLDPSKYGGALWELARGCPFKCSYCYESKGEKKIAYFPMERLEKEIELFAQKKIAQVFVLDPTYNASKERAIKMLKIIERKAPAMFFYFEARAEFIDRELARAFARIPCCLQIGLQSANPEVLKNVHRTLDKKKFTRNIGFLNKAGVTFGFDLIYGLPGDTFRGFCESIDFALSLYPNNLELFCLSVLPGTDLHDDATGFGLEWEQNPPYHVKKTPTFSERDLKKAETLASATNLFYTKGRAVAWFNSILYVLKEKPSEFLRKFVEFLEKIPASGRFAHGELQAGMTNATVGMTKSDAEMSAVASDKPQSGFFPTVRREKKGTIGHGKNVTVGLDPIILTADKNSAQIEKLQIAFIQARFHEKRLDRLLPAAEDLIRLHAALGRCTFDGTESTFTTHYHPDDVMSEYGTDIEFFTENCGKQKCRVRVFKGKNGADWRVL